VDATGPAGLTVGELRRARRAFVLAQHPDRGGDPAAFAAGLARFALLLDQAGQGTPGQPGTTRPTSGAARDAQAGASPRVVVIRRPRGITDWLLYLAGAAAGRRLRPRRHLQ